MDSGVLGKRSLVAAYSAGFIGIGLAGTYSKENEEWAECWLLHKVFGLTYGLHVFKEKLIEQVYQGGLGCQTDDSDVEDGQNGDQSAEAWAEPWAAQLTMSSVEVRKLGGQLRDEHAGASLGPFGVLLVKTLSLYLTWLLDFSHW
jgi:hypothetical protein